MAKLVSLKKKEKKSTVGLFVTRDWVRHPIGLFQFVSVFRVVCRPYRLLTARKQVILEYCFFSVAPLVPMAEDIYEHVIFIYSIIRPKRLKHNIWRLVTFCWSLLPFVNTFGGNLMSCVNFKFGHIFFVVMHIYIYIYNLLSTFMFCWMFCVC